MSHIKYELIPFEDINSTFYLIRRTDDETYFSGYDSMGCAKWSDNPSNGYQLARHEAEAVMDDIGGK